MRESRRRKLCGLGTSSVGYMLLYPQTSSENRLSSPRAHAVTAKQYRCPGTTVNRVRGGRSRRRMSVSSRRVRDRLYTVYLVTSGSEGLHASVKVSASALTEKTDVTRHDSATITHEPRARRQAGGGAAGHVAGDVRSDVTPASTERAEWWLVRRHECHRPAIGC